MTRGGVVLTVNGDRDVVERQLACGELACPSCGGVLGGWGNARLRRADAVVVIGAALEAAAAGDGHRKTGDQGQSAGTRHEALIFPATLVLPWGGFALLR